MLALLRDKKVLVLLGILFIGFVLRIYRLTETSLYGDELTMVYDTYSLLKTGKDATGETFPLTFRMGAGRPGGYIYASIPFVALFGPTAYGVRGLSIFSGLGIILLVYLLAKKIFGEKLGLWASALAVISPWDIYLSRGGFEAHFGLFLALLGLTAFFYARNQPRLYFLWAGAWGLSIHTYPTFKLTLPLLFVVLLWYTASFKKIIKNRFFVLGVIFLSFFGVLAVRESLMGRSEERFLRLNVFANSNLEERIIQEINEERTISTLPVSLRPLFYNRYWAYSRILFENYMGNLSEKFLYLRGDGNPRHNPGEMGMLYLVELPLLFVAISYPWREKKRQLVFIVFWILITPLASMFLPEAHALRSALVMPAFILLSAYAFSRLKRPIQVVVVVLALVQLVFILQRVYFFAPAKFGDFWSRPAKEASLAAIENKSQEKTVVFSTKIDNIEYAYPVYAQLDPNLVMAQYGKFPKIYGDVVITDK